MKIPKQGARNKNKKQSPLLEQQINSDDLPSDAEPHQADRNGREQVDLRTPEQVKISIAKKLIQKTKATLTKKTVKERRPGDDFFIQEQGEGGVAASKVDGEAEENTLAEELKNQYLRSKNKLFVNQQTHFRKVIVGEPVAYKGHTKCITGFEITDTRIFSVSKDRSIINWDRETGKKDFITMAKQNSTFDHEGPILCMSYHAISQMIATAGEDGTIKLWDVRTNTIIDTLKGHRNTVNGIKFGVNSNNLCSVSADLTMKQWQSAQRGIIETYYGHDAEVLDIDAINSDDFVSSGNDHQVVVWKTEKESQIILQGHDYAIDRVRAINEQKCITACQDGSINLWTQKKKKPIHKHANAHSSWIGALDCIKQTNIFATGDCQGVVKIWSAGAELKGIEPLHQIQAKGIVTDLKLSDKEIAVTSCDEHRLGRWLTTRVRNQIQVFRFSWQ